MGPQEREYELVLFGATGHTGRLTAEHITTHLPSDLKWAVAGRSGDKLAALVKDIKSLNPDRQQPSVEVAGLNKSELDALARKTRLIIATVGPYAIYGTPVFEACATNGTHYLDVTGEIPWVSEMIQKYHETAKANGAIMIPEIGVESAPSDMISWSLVSLLRAKASLATEEIILSVHEMKATPSGGTGLTMASLFEQYSLKEFAAAAKPWALSPLEGSKVPSSTGLLGVRTVPGLGLLTTSFSGTFNRAIVHRSWGLIGSGKFYGPKFHYSEYMRAKNTILGFIIHIVLTLAIPALVFPPTRYFSFLRLKANDTNNARWLLKKFLYAPGSGPSREQANRESIEYRAIAVADEDVSSPTRAFGRLRYEGSIYYMTGVFAAEAAIVILRSQEEILAKKLGGGVLTPATLGQPYVDRLEQAGVRIETKLLD
ncbi:MAG: hypothetical protein M1833_002953 [Piccolia ochrophora]|nr:MAG: hypothetical protein M1833_002953 [Piccolia ochrophora]